MRILSVFSGAGGMDMGLEKAGHEIVGFCEKEKTAKSVLEYKWPNIETHDDIETFYPATEFDAIAGGSPCQNLSMVGNTKGLVGEQSRLFWHQCRIADQSGTKWFIWENVRGSLWSNRGQDFAAVLWGVTGAFPDVPSKGWGNSGVVSGPKRTAVWRVFDARYFGVPQRRRRIFLVAGPRGLCGPEILFECESLQRRDTPSKREREREREHFSAEKYHDRSRSSIVESFGWQNSVSQGAEVLTEAVATIRANTVPAVLVDGIVRKLTPVECERLMGWPDDHTRFGLVDGQTVEVSNTARYRMCGNGVASPITEWIGKRIHGT